MAIHYSAKNKLIDNNGRILVLDVIIDGMQYLLMNLYNGNTEPEQLNISKSLSKISKKFQHLSQKISFLKGTLICFFTRS